MNTNTNDTPYRKYAAAFKPTADESVEGRTISAFPGGHNVEQKLPNLSERKSTDDAMRELEKGFGDPWEDLGRKDDSPSTAFGSNSVLTVENSRDLRKINSLFCDYKKELEEVRSKLMAVKVERNELELENVKLRLQLKRNGVVPVESSMPPTQLDSSMYTAGPVPSSSGEQYESTVQGGAHHRPAPQYASTSFLRHYALVRHPNLDRQARFPFIDPIRTVGPGSFRPQESENAQVWGRAGFSRRFGNEQEEQHGNEGAR